MCILFTLNKLFLQVRNFVDPYTKREQKLVDMGIVGRVLDKLPEDLKEAKMAEEKKSVKW